MTPDGFGWRHHPDQDGYTKRRELGPVSPECAIRTGHPIRHLTARPLSIMRQPILQRVTEQQQCQCVVTAACTATASTATCSGTVAVLARCVGTLITVIASTAAVSASVATVSNTALKQCSSSRVSISCNSQSTAALKQCSSSRVTISCNSQHCSTKAVQQQQCQHQWQQSALQH